MALMWANILADGSVDKNTLHMGEAPSKGIKFGMNVWVCEKPRFGDYAHIHE